MPQTAKKLEIYDGTEVTVDPVKQLSGGGTRVDIEAADGPRWRLDISRTGNVEIVTTWNAEGELADVELPDWMDDVIARLQHA